MELNKIILEVLEKYKDMQPNMASNAFRNLLSNELEKEVGKYCMTLVESVVCETPPNNA